MKIDGRCHCGFLSYEAEADPDSVVIRHCTDCQTLSATAFRTAIRVGKDDFKLLSGEPTTYVTSRRRSFPKKSSLVSRPPSRVARRG